MDPIKKISRPGWFRPFIQWVFLLWCVIMGVRFGAWLRGLRNPEGPWVSRPAGVEGFLPLGAVISLKHWMVNGVIDSVHPAALVLFLTFVGMSLLARRSFCSFVCPVAPISEWLWKGGRRLWRKDIRPWKWLDYGLRAVKYLLLALILKLVFLDMPASGTADFIHSPYWAVADIRMWRFFADISLTALGILLGLAVASLIYRNFWCRYLCPYGALVGLAGFFSPWKIRRLARDCTECGACSRVCPSWLPVMEKSVVRSVECTGCLTCVDSCPQKGVLRMGVHGVAREWPWWTYPAFVLALFALGVGAGMTTGHWHGSLSAEEIRRFLVMPDPGR